MKLQDIKSGTNLSGVEPAQIVNVVATVPHGDGALQLIYRTPDGGMKERLLGIWYLLATPGADLAQRKSV
jgi:hypothetical protein